MSIEKYKLEKLTVGNIINILPQDRDIPIEIVNKYSVDKEDIELYYSGTRKLFEKNPDIILDMLASMNVVEFTVYTEENDSDNFILCLYVDPFNNFGLDINYQSLQNLVNMSYSDFQDHELEEDQHVFDMLNTIDDPKEDQEENEIIDWNIVTTYVDRIRKAIMTNELIILDNDITYLKMIHDGQDADGFIKDKEIWIYYMSFIKIIQEFIKDDISQDRILKSLSNYSIISTNENSDEFTKYTTVLDGTVTRFFRIPPQSLQLYIKEDNEEEEKKNEKEVKTEERSYPQVLNLYIEALKHALTHYEIKINDWDDFKKNPEEDAFIYRRKILFVRADKLLNVFRNADDSFNPKIIQLMIENDILKSNEEDYVVKIKGIDDLFYMINIDALGLRPSSEFGIDQTIEYESQEGTKVHLPDKVDKDEWRGPTPKDYNTLNTQEFTKEFVLWAANNNIHSINTDQFAEVFNIGKSRANVMMSILVRSGLLRNSDHNDTKEVDKTNCFKYLQMEYKEKFGGNQCKYCLNYSGSSSDMRQVCQLKDIVVECDHCCSEYIPSMRKINYEEDMDEDEEEINQETKEVDKSFRPNGGLTLEQQELIQAMMNSKKKRMNWLPNEEYLKAFIHYAIKNGIESISINDFMKEFQVNRWKAMQLLNLFKQTGIISNGESRLKPKTVSIEKCKAYLEILDHLEEFEFCRFCVHNESSVLNRYSHCEHKDTTVSTMQSSKTCKEFVCNINRIDRYNKVVETSEESKK